MCYNVSLIMDQPLLEQRFAADAVEAFPRVYHASGFRTPRHPVITTAAPDRIQLYYWGLIPGWVTDAAAATKIRTRTLNARAETLFEKPAFRAAAATRRCLVLADGFFEWRHVGGETYPYYIRLRSRAPFAFAGLYEHWRDPSPAAGERGGTEIDTFCIITTVANDLLARVHNTRERMPVLLPRAAERRWLEGGTATELRALLRPYPADEMEAYPVSKALGKPEHSNTPAILERQRYAALETVDRYTQTRLF